MRRLIFLTLACVLYLGFGLFVNCSSPLDKSTGPDPEPPLVRVDTVFVIDTIIQIDSVGGTDTLFMYDTLYVNDTTILIDTIPVYDTVTIYDTVIDTTIILDSTIYYDTVTVYDTTIIYDTVIVEDSTDGSFVCGQLGSSRKELVWLFNNDAGTILLEFAASSEQDKPTQIVSVEIDGVTYLWNLSESLELVIEQDLSEDAIIKITPDKPPSFGHAVDICLSLSTE